MKTIHFLLAICIANGIMICITSGDTQKEIKQSNQQHTRLHNLIIDSVRTHKMIERVDFDLGCEPCRVVVECEK